MRDVLFLSYFFPPMGGGAVLRALKFAKYLPECGWRPLVVAGGSGYHVRDESLLAEVPEAAVVRRAGGRGEGCPPSKALAARAARRLSRGARRLVSFPDIYSWFGRPAYHEARRLLAECDAKLIFSTAPPYTSHVVAARLAREAGLPLVLDYRDAWSDNPFDKPPTPLHRRRAARAEAAVLGAAEAAVAVTEGMAASYRRRLPDDKPVVVIANGYDEEDFAEEIPAAGGPFVAAYSGQLYGSRMPWTFLEAASRFARRCDPGAGGFVVRFAGPVGRKVMARAKASGVRVEALGVLGHRDAVRAMRAADANVLIIGPAPGAEATLTGKIFEYLRAGRPILALVPPRGEAAALVREFDAGVVVSPEDAEGAAAALEAFYDGRGGAPRPAAAGLKRFERRRLTAELAELFDNVAAG
jgi:glycosyltransferase involved in cell wall biosynthesis